MGITIDRTLKLLARSLDFQRLDKAPLKLRALRTLTLPADLSTVSLSSAQEVKEPGFFQGMHLSNNSLATVAAKQVYDS